MPSTLPWSFIIISTCTAICSQAWIFSYAIPVDQAINLRLTKSLKDYRVSTKRRIILSDGGKTSLLVIFASLLLLDAGSYYGSIYLARGLPSGSKPGLGLALAKGAAYFFTAGTLLVSAFAAFMAAGQPELKVIWLDDGPTIEDEAIPVAVLAKHHASEAGVWHKVASTSRRHDVLMRIDAKQGQYEIRTEWAPDHPLYHPTQPGAGRASNEPDPIRGAVPATQGSSTKDK